MRYFKTKISQHKAKHLFFKLTPKLSMSWTTLTSIPARVSKSCCHSLSRGLVGLAFCRLSTRSKATLHDFATTRSPRTVRSTFGRFIGEWLLNQRVCTFSNGHSFYLCWRTYTKLPINGLSLVTVVGRWMGWQQNRSLNETVRLFEGFIWKKLN